MQRWLLVSLATGLALSSSCTCDGGGPQDAGEDAGTPDTGPSIRRTSADASFSALDLYVAPGDERIAAAWVPRQKGNIARYILDFARVGDEYDFNNEGDAGLSTWAVNTGLAPDASYKMFVSAIDPNGQAVVGDPNPGPGLPDAGGPPSDGGEDGGSADAAPRPDASVPLVAKPLVSPERIARTATPVYSPGKLTLTSITADALEQPAVIPWDTARVSAIVKRGTSLYSTFSDDRGQSWLALRFVDFDVLESRAAADPDIRRLYACYSKGSPASLYLAYSNDLGVSWTRVVVATLVSGPACDVAVGKNGRVFVLGEQPDKLSVWRSDTQGASFQAISADIDVAGSALHAPQPRMAADPARNFLYVAYEMDAAQSRDGGPADYDVLVATSGNGGLGFRSPSSPVVHAAVSPSVKECLPLGRAYSQTDPTLYVDVGSTKGTVWVGFTDERGGACAPSPGCAGGVIALSDDNGLEFECTGEWKPGVDLGSDRDLSTSPQAVSDFRGRLFLLFGARSRLVQFYSLYLTRFDPEARNRRGEFYPPDPSNALVSRRSFDGTLPAKTERQLSAAADPHASVWLFWPGTSATSGPGIYSVVAP